MITLSGYQLYQKLYESPSSIIYRGQKDKNPQSLIIKTLNSLHPSPQEINKLRQEYHILKQLEHLNGIIHAYNFEIINEQPLLILEDIQGYSLNQLNFAGNLNSEQFFNLIFLILDSLSALHNAHFIHQDVNPSNIIYSPQYEQLKLIDFGNSIPFHEQYFTTYLKGTLAYLAPEQTGRINLSLDYRTDYYNLGITCYQLVTGQLPFQAKSAGEYIHCHLAKQPPLITDCQFNYRESFTPILPELAQIIAKLMEKNPENRYQSIQGIKADLEFCYHHLNQESQEVFVLAQQDYSTELIIPQKLYGRDESIDLLNRKIEATIADNSNPELCLIRGYSGVGKSALVRYIRPTINQYQGFFLSGKFDQYQNHQPYFAFSQALKQFCEYLLTESTPVLEEWKSKILTAVGNNGEVLIRVIPLLELIIGSQPVAPCLSLQEEENRFNLVCENFLQTIAQKDHPLVLFLDDLQWADLASLNLIQTLITNSNINYFLLLGAYRDQEIHSDHSLQRMFDRLENTSANLSFITLENLTFEDINRLISDLLKSSLNNTKLLTKLIYQKTQGNIFFTLEFIKSLYEKKILFFDIHTCQWNWNLKEIEAQNNTDNVVNFMTEIITKLPVDTQELLQIAASLGNIFSFSLLATVANKTYHDLHHSLNPALTAGIIYSLSSDYPLISFFNNEIPFILPELHFKFKHDRIQQSAYLLLNESQRLQQHLRIGQLLLQRTSPNHLENNIFEIISHLNKALQLINDPPLKLTLAELNLQAGRKAKRANAYGESVKYLRQGLHCLSSNPWQNEYNLTLALYQELTESEYLTTNYQEAEKLSEIVLENALELLDKIPIYLSQIQFYSAQNRLQESADTCLNVLKLLGVELVTIPPILPPSSQLENLSINENPYHLSALKVLAIFWGTAIIITPDLVPSMSFTMVDICLKSGHSELAPFAYAYYGLNLCGLLGNIELGYQLGELSLYLLHKLKVEVTQCKVNHIFNAFIRHWKEPITHCIEGLQKTIQLGLETGDIEYACYASMQYSSYSFLTGEPLDRVLIKFQESAKRIRHLKQEFQLNYNKIWYQLADNFYRLSPDPMVLEGEYFQESIMIDYFEKNSNETSLFCVYLAKLMLCYYWQNYDQAVIYANLAHQYQNSIASLAGLGQLYFYSTLSYLAVYHQAFPSQQETLLKTIQEGEEKLSQWAKSCPSNYQHKYYLVLAEKNKIFDNLWSASEYYEQAIQWAKEANLLQELALIYELAGNFYLSHNRVQFAQNYLKSAHQYYSAWQGYHKIYYLESCYPHLFSIRVQPLTETVTIKRQLFNLDIETLMNVSQTISSEVELPILLEKLMKIILQNSNAQRGYIFLNFNDKWTIEAQGNIDNNAINVLQSIPLKDNYENNTALDFSVSIVHYVIRTQETVILEKANEDNRFINDHYLITNQPQSIFCTPLLKQKKLVGVLYLENNLTSSAFNVDRTKFINFLASEAAIAIENAHLYAELSLNKNQLKQLLENLPIGVAVHDNRGKVIYMNNTGEKLIAQDKKIGTEPENLANSYQIFKTGTDILYPVDQLPAIRSLQGEYVIADDLEIHIDGKIIPIEIRSIPMYDDQHNVVETIHVFQDITLRKKSEQLLNQYNEQLEKEVQEKTQALQASEAKFRSAFETAAVGMCLINIEGKLIDINSALCNLLGYEKEELLALNFKDLVYADDLAQNLQLMDNILSETINYYHVEKRCLHKTGKIIWVFFSASLVRDDNHNPLYFIGQAQDISKRKQAETLIQEYSVSLEAKVIQRTEELRKQQEQYRMIVETANEGVWMTNAELKTTFVNSEMSKMIGYSIEEILGKSVFDFTDDQGKSMILNNLNRRKQGIKEQHDFKFIHKDGQEIWAIISSTPFFDEKGEYQGTLAMVTDITKRKQFEVELQESLQRERDIAYRLQKAKELADSANRAKSEFLANMSHEIRTPMNAILGFSNLLGRKVTDEKIVSYVQAINSGGQMLMALINDILDLSKIESGKLELSYTSFHFRSFLQEIKEIFSQKAFEKNLTLNLEVSPEVPHYLMTDMVRLRQILFNLIGNALKFTEEGTITVKVEVYVYSSLQNSNNQTYSSILKIQVQDTGIGIAQADQKNIFNPFIQAEGQSTRKYGGAGLGLAITHRLTEMLGGIITLESEKGVGSNFILTIPLLQGDSKPRESFISLDSKYDNLNQFSPLVILAVDDILSNLELLEAYFQDTHHRLICTTKAEEVVALAMEYSPDLILLDLLMPTKDGKEVLKDLRANENTKSIPVIILTAFAIKEEIESLFKICEGVLSKPFTPEQLITQFKKLFISQVEDSSSTETAVSAVVIALSTEQKKQLIHQLKVYEIESWETLRKTRIRRQIRRFIEILKDWANLYQYPPLQNYANLLESQMNNYDLPNLNLTLESFPQFRIDLENELKGDCYYE